MSISFHVLLEKKQFMWIMARRIKSYFNISYCRKGKGIWTFIDDNCSYIIKLTRKCLYFNINNSTDKCTNDIVDKCIEFINSNYKNSTLGFKQTSGNAILLNKFKDIKIINLTDTKINKTFHPDDDAAIAMNKEAL